MTAVAENSLELPRWVFSALVVIGVHAALAMMLTGWHEPVEADEGNDAIVVDLAPFTAPPSETKDDLAPGPVQQQSEGAPDAEPPKPEEKPEDKPELPPQPDADVMLPAEPVKPPDQLAAPPGPLILETTAPPRPKPSAAQIASWNRKIALQVERHKGYPAAARARHETGIAELAFTIDRLGMVVTTRVVRSSGFASLDQETIDTVKRAQPFPPPPQNMPGLTFEFTIPIGFHIRNGGASR